MTENYICQYSEILGFNALYNVIDQSELPEGSIVVAVVATDKFIFQTAETVDILEEEVDEVMVLEGTLTHLPDFKDMEFATFKAAEIDYFKIDCLRFPTKQELDWYNDLDTV